MCYPLDVVRRQMQVEGLKLQEAAATSPTAQLSAGGQQLSLRSTPQALVLLVQRHGWRCLFAGLSINYLKVRVAGQLVTLRPADAAACWH